jgi:hypothetical protein
MLAGLARGSVWGIATHRDVHGLKPWLAALEPGLRSAALKPLRVLAFGESPKLDVESDPPPITEALFLAALRGKNPSEIGHGIYPYDPELPWACTEQVSNKLDFTRLLADPVVFKRDMEWVAATVPAEPAARAKELANVVKIAAYRALSEEDGEKRLTEFYAFATAVERIAGSRPTDVFRSAAAPFLESTKGTWCSLQGSFATAIAGGTQNSRAAEADLRGILESYERSKEGDLGKTEQWIAVHGLARLAHRRPLDRITLQALYRIIMRDDSDITAITPATALLAELAVSQELGPDLQKLLFDNLRPVRGAADFAPLTATNFLARNSRFLDSGQKTTLQQWLATEAPANALVSTLHEAIGFVALTGPIPANQLGLLQARLPSLSRFPLQATNYRGEPVISASGDSAAIALGRVAQSIPLPADVTERLANFAAARTEVKGREEIIRGLAKQWFGKNSSLSETIQKRLARCSGDANKRALEIEVAGSELIDLSAKERKQLLGQLVPVWSREIEPSQRIALARLIGLVAPD